MELINLQSDLALKETFLNGGWNKFFCALSSEKFSNMKRFVFKMMVLFGSTYICEQAFSTMNINKSKRRSLLTDGILHSELRISTMNIEPDFKIISKDASQFHGSH